MAKKLGKRIYRQATVEEQERHKRIREQIQEELPDIKQRAQQKARPSNQVHQIVQGRLQPEAEDRAQDAYLEGDDDGMLQVHDIPP